MTDYYDLMPELEIHLGDVFKPDLEQILLYMKEDKVFVRLVYAESSGIPSVDEDLYFVVDGTEPMFKTEYSLEGNTMVFFGYSGQY
jgi:hypothetical protein